MSKETISHLSPGSPYNRQVVYHSPPSPAPTSTDSEQVQNNELQARGDFDDAEPDEIGARDITDDLSGAADLLGRLDVKDPNSKDEALQNNGVCGTVTTVVRILVTAPVAEGHSIQNNGFVEDERFFTSRTTRRSR